MKSRTRHLRRLSSSGLLIFCAVFGTLLALLLVSILRPSGLSSVSLGAITGLTALAALAGCGATYVACHFLVILPLNRLRQRELDPLAISRSIPYPAQGLEVVHFLLVAFDDFRLQREALSRLSDAYRSLALFPQQGLSLNQALTVSLHSGLAQHVTALRFDARTATLELLSDGPELSAEEREMLAQEIESEHMEFLNKGRLWIATPLSPAGSLHLVLRIEPRRLWVRTPKMYRRFFATLATTIITHVLLRKDTPSPRIRERRAAGNSRTGPAPEAGAPPLDLELGHDGAAAAHLLPAGKRSLFLINGNETEDLSPVLVRLGIAQRKGVKHSADFLNVSFSTQAQRSLTFLGSAPHRERDATYAACAAASLLAELLPGIPLADELSDVLRRVTKAIERTGLLIFRMFGGQMPVRLACVYFDHQVGKGFSVCFGNPAPYLVSPDERKPLFISPSRRSEGLLGLEPTVKVHFTEFTVMPGQFVAASTAGMLSLRDAQRRTFEREIARGRLSLLDPAILASTPDAIAEAIMDEAEKHTSSSVLSDDLTLVCLTSSDGL